MAVHECKHENRINRIDREQGESQIALKSLVERVDTLIKVGIAVGVTMFTSTLATLGFLFTFWVRNGGT